MISNKYIKIKTQTAFLEGVAGCIENGTIVFQALCFAKITGISICTSWLDLAIACGLVRYSFVQSTVKWYHVPGNVRKMLDYYYHGVLAHIHTDSLTSEWFQIAVGVPQGCTACTIVLDVIF